ncbi:hypothetical protein K5Z09_005055 [Escherichia coli]|nr:hypothetical protein [Escherichia coli]EHR8987599.1 hypothetical protein [Escherichia coli]EHR9219764.1 hypothetical protein [Escherichia coli]EIM2921406.1 hypothetical protein [Escherichia coli]EIM2960271.1 hypothetical protein [Escherichia coli]
MKLCHIKKISDIVLFYVLNGVACGGLFLHWHVRFVESEIHTPATFLRETEYVLMIYSVVSFLFMIAPSLLSNILYHRTGLYAYTRLCRHRPLLVMGCYIMVPVTCQLPLSFLMDGGATLLFIVIAPFLIFFSASGKNQN